LQTVRHRFNICSSSCVALALQRGDGHWATRTRYMLRRNTASIMKGLVFGLTNGLLYNFYM